MRAAGADREKAVAPATGPQILIRRPAGVNVRNLRFKLCEAPLDSSGPPWDQAGGREHPFTVDFRAGLLHAATPRCQEWPGATPRPDFARSLISFYARGAQ